MFFPVDYYKNKVESLWICKCSFCPEVKRDLKILRSHTNQAHNMQLCLLCIEHKQVFPSEQKIYTQALYEKHLKFGDGDGSTGHPNCEFCKKRHYDSSALFYHLSKEHYTCFICEKMDVKFKYFGNYSDLENHFRRSQYEYI